MKQQVKPKTIAGILVAVVALLVLIGWKVLYAPPSSGKNPYSGDHAQASNGKAPAGVPIPGVNGGGGGASGVMVPGGGPPGGGPPGSQYGGPPGGQYGGPPGGAPGGGNSGGSPYGGPPSGGPPNSSSSGN